MVLGTGAENNVHDTNSQGRLGTQVSVDKMKVPKSHYLFCFKTALKICGFTIINNSILNEHPI